MVCTKVHRRYQAMCSAAENQKYSEQQQNKTTDVSLHHLAKIDSWWLDNNSIKVSKALSDNLEAFEFE